MDVVGGGLVLLCFNPTTVMVVLMFGLWLLFGCDNNPSLLVRALKMDLLQYVNFTHFLYERIECTDQLPHPLITWLGVGTDQIQAAWDTAAIDAPDLDTAHLHNSMTG